MKKFYGYAVLVGLFAAMISCASAPVGGVRFPEPSPGFTPKKVYTVKPVNLVNVIEAVFEENRILIEDQKPLKIVTEFIQGQTESFAGGLGGTINTRYKYVLQLKSQGKKTSLVILCRLESSGGEAQTPWHDISGDNPDVVRVLENWLYEQIERKLM